VYVVQTTGFVALIQTVVGVLLAYIFFPPIPPHLMMMLDEYDLSASLLKNPSFQFEWRQITGTLAEAAKAWTTNRDFKVGTELAEKGLSAKYPVVLIPGIVSTVRRCEIAASTDSTYYWTGA
jgi:phospholipid:diacylglycerol acyltransferase